MHLTLLKNIFQKKHRRKILVLILGSLFLIVLNTDGVIKNQGLNDVVFDYLQTELKELEGRSTIPTEKSLGTELFNVVKIIDGDTIDVSLDGVKTRIRIIGIDTPETNIYECYGKEATDEARRFFRDKKVVLEVDSTQQNKDRYGRLLRFVSVDEVDYGLHVLEKGFAREYTYREPYKYTDIYREAQAKAKHSELGLWGDFCNKKTPLER